MDYSILIDDHFELILISNTYNLYISRRSLKHFVESRKKEMTINHSKKEILSKLYFAIDNIVEIYCNFDDMKNKDEYRVIYIKNFNTINKHSLRIVFDKFEDRLEICSIHFQKRKKPP